MYVKVVAAQGAAQPGRVGDHRSGEAENLRVVGEGLQPDGHLVGGGTGERVDVIDGELRQLFSAGERLFGFDLGAEAGRAGAKW